VTCHSSWASMTTAVARRRNAAGLGKISTTSARRLISLFKRSWVIYSPAVGQGCELAVCGVDGVRDAHFALGCRSVKRSRHWSASKSSDHETAKALESPPNPATRGS
jgi:hypothetical protein